MQEKDHIKSFEDRFVPASVRFLLHPLCLQKSKYQ